MEHDRKNAQSSSPWSWRVQPADALLFVLFGIGLAYAMDHSRTPLVQIRVSSERDIAPSQVSLRISPPLPFPVKMIVWDYEGDGTIDARGQDLVSQIVTFSSAGQFFPSVIITDQQGRTYEGTAQVMIDDEEELQALLNSRWMGMLTALENKDVEKTLTFVASNRYGHEA